jgi:toxin ParE1/3/4
MRGILATSRERWGEAARRRYASLLVTAIRGIARTPEGPAARRRADLSPDVRSLHAAHVQGVRSVREPVHVIYYRFDGVTVEILRVLHDRMDLSRHSGFSR